MLIYSDKCSWWCLFWKRAHASQAGRSRRRKVSYFLIVLGSEKIPSTRFGRPVCACHCLHTCIGGKTCILSSDVTVCVIDINTVCMCVGWIDFVRRRIQMHGTIWCVCCSDNACMYVQIISYIYLHPCKLVARSSLHLNCSCNEHTHMGKL